MNDTEILNIVQKCIEKSVSTKNLSEICTFILKELSTILIFDYAFVAEIRYKTLEENSRSKFYRYHAYYGVKQHSELHKFYKSHINDSGSFDFKNMNTFHGKLADKPDDECLFNNITDICQTPLPEGHPDIKSFRCYKLTHQNKVLGIIAFGRNEVSEFSTDFNNTINKILPFITSIFANVQKRTIIEKHKDIFLANMSHEVRTPLHGIVSLTKLLTKTDLNSEQVEYVNIISQCSVQLFDIISDILDYAKINSGKMKFNKSYFNLKQCLENARDLVMIKESNSSHLVPINITLASNLPQMIITDQTRLCQVIVNIAGNAQKFTQEGEINIKAQLMSTNSTTDECEIYFSISDTGIGIPKDKIETIFDSFQQLSNNIFENNTGVGLGLPICKFIVEKFGGKIWIDSKVGAGTIVHFTMKCSPYTAKIDETKLTEYFKNRTFLLVENNTEDKTLIFNTLLKFKAKPILCLELKDVIMYIKSKIFTIEYLIININNLTIEEIRIINELQENLTKIVLLSDTKTEILKNIKHHYDIMKPVTVDKILNTLDTICRTSKHIHKSTPIFKKKNSLDSVDSVDAVDINLGKIAFSQGMEKDINAGSSSITHVHRTIGDKINVLIAEDNETNRLVITKLLHKLGYFNIEYAINGYEMVKAVLKKKYDIVFVDLKMPIMDGITATKEIKKQVHEDNLPLLAALTASVTEETRKMCFKIGMKAFLPKPIEIDDLETIMSIVVKKAPISNSN